MVGQGFTTRRDFIKFLGLSAAGGVLAAACGPTATPTPAPAPKASQPTTAPAAATQPTAKPTTAPVAPATAQPKASGSSTVVRLHVKTGVEADTLADILPQFEKDKGISVKVESFPTNEYFQKLQVLLAGGNAGDVMWGVAYTGQGAYHAQNGIVMYLDDLVKADKFDLEQYYAPAIEGCRHKSQLFGLPYKLHPGPIGLFYNTTLTKEAGISDLKVDSHQKLVETAKMLTKNQGGRTTQWGFVPVYGSIPHMYVQWTRAFGGDTMSKDGTKATINSPESMAGLSFLYEMIFTHKVTPTMAQVNNNETEVMFIAGTVGSLQAASSTKSIPTRIKDKFKVENVLMPKGPTGRIGTWMVTDFIGINAKTQVKDASWETMKLLAGKEFGIRLGEGKGGASGTCGGRKDVYEDPRLMANPLHPVFLDSLNLKEEGNEMRIPANFRGEEFNKLLGQRLGSLWLGDEKPTKALFDDVNKSLQDILNKAAP